MKIFIITITIVLSGLLGFAWGWGLHGLMAINRRKKIIYDARKQSLSFPPTPREVNQ